MSAPEKKPPKPKGAMKSADRDVLALDTIIQAGKLADATQHLWRVATERETYAIDAEPTITDAELDDRLRWLHKEVCSVVRRYQVKYPEVE